MLMKAQAHGGRGYLGERRPRKRSAWDSLARPPAPTRPRLPQRPSPTRACFPTLVLGGSIYGLGMPPRSGLCVAPPLLLPYVLPLGLQARGPRSNSRRFSAPTPQEPASMTDPFLLLDRLAPPLRARFESTTINCRGDPDHHWAHASSRLTPPPSPSPSTPCGLR